jgi:hypothetical protein
MFCGDFCRTIRLGCCGVGIVLVSPFKSTTSALGCANSGTITPSLAVRPSHSAFRPHSSTYRTFLGSTSNGSKGADGGLDRFAPLCRTLRFFSRTRKADICPNWRDSR